MTDSYQARRRSRLAPGETPLPGTDTNVNEAARDRGQHRANCEAIRQPSDDQQDGRALNVVVVDVNLPFLSIARMLVYLVVAIVPASVLLILFVLGVAGLLSVHR